MDYQKQAQDFLDKNGITFKAVHVSGECPKWCEDGKHIHGDKHRITFKRKGKRFSLAFWNSYDDRQKGEKPDAYGVLACLTKRDPGSFEDFCSEFGYDNDIRLAKKNYKGVVKEWEEVKGFFSDSELSDAQEIK